MKSTIKRLTDKNFGFIAAENSDKDIFFHASKLVDVNFSDLEVGDEVTFDVENSEKGPAAVNVQRA
ncbi:MAG: cold shock domain-containing protein [Ignavibacteriae bacterium]|nr:cold shock domain-containing protein [Ignavibacteriota bacterium]MCB9242827.1 cold shock domain-containing protein [Ignavibacteriales bacterium]